MTKIPQFKVGNIVILTIQEEKTNLIGRIREIKYSRGIPIRAYAYFFNLDTKSLWSSFHDELILSTFSFKQSSARIAYLKEIRIYEKELEPMLTRRLI